MIPPRLRNFNVLSPPTHENWVQIMLWELLAADVEGVEGIGAVGTVFEKVFFGLRLLFHRLVFAEAVASSLHSCGLDGEDKVIVVLSVEVRHKALLTDKALVEVVSKLLFCYIHIIPKQTLIMSHTAFLGEADYQNEDIIR